MRTVGLYKKEPIQSLKLDPETILFVTYNGKERKEKLWKM
jgi:hypothetical protein